MGATELAPARYAAASRLELDRIPLVVGVTGHRNIALTDEGPLRGAFAAVLGELAAKCPATQLVVLSGLAAGTDILAAEEAIAQGVPVIAALPMPVEMYEHDFSEPEKVRFRAVLAACARVTVVAKPEERRDGYVATGLFLAHYSHVLVSFWDGLPGNGDGGTADVVRIRTTGDTAHLDDIASIPYLPDIGPVYHIVTPREDAPRPADAYALIRIYPKRFRDDSFVERDLAAAVKHFDCYNADLRRYAPPSTAVEPSMRTLRDRTDAVAGKLQATTNRFQLLLYVFGFFAASVQVIHFPAYLKVIGIALTFVFYWLARRFDYENRYQDYRALAEGLRVQEAWACAGLGREWVDASYLSMQQSELQWIRMALRCAYLMFCEDTDSEPCPTHAVCQDWIDGQWQYYKVKTADQTKRLKNINFAGSAAFAVAIAVAAIAAAIADPSLIGSFLHAHGLWPAQLPLPSKPVWSRNLVGLLIELQTVPIALAAVGGSLLWQWGEQRNYAANSRRYQRMFVVFDRAKSRLKELGNERTADALAVIRGLGREALIEHADWLLTRRDRPISVAHV